jgi:hypothetical protein
VRWICRSTSSNVNGYEVYKLPIIMPENQELIANIVKQIMILKAKNSKELISHLEQELNEKVWELFELKR